MLLCGDDTFLREMMLNAHEEGMTKGDYVYISTDVLAVDNYERRWVSGDPATDALARQAFQPLLQASNDRRRSPEMFYDKKRRHTLLRTANARKCPLKSKQLSTGWFIIKSLKLPFTRRATVNSGATPIS